MFKNYIKTAFRSLLKNKGFTFLNVLGLSLGLATCLLIVFYVADELSYDRYNVKADRIFRVNTDMKLGDNITNFAIAAPAVSPSLTGNFPEIERSVRLPRQENVRFRKAHQDIQQFNIARSAPRSSSV